MFGGDAGDPGRLRIKICGITNAADAEAAIEFGADALGLNCYPGSKRYLELASAADWITHLPAEVSKVAVLVNPAFEEAIAIARLPFINGLQLHGAETAEFGARLLEQGVHFAKALPVVEPNSLENVPFYGTDWLVLDSEGAGSFGGSGKSFPWAIAGRFVEAHPQYRVILAGGLTPENVAQAVKEVRPFGVDVTTGVERSPRLKDRGRLQAFIEAARQASFLAPSVRDRS